MSVRCLLITQISSSIFDKFLENQNGFFCFFSECNKILRSIKDYQFKFRNLVGVPWKLTVHISSSVDGHIYPQCGPPAWDRDNAVDLEPDGPTSSRKWPEYTGPGSQGTATNGDT